MEFEKPLLKGSEGLEILALSRIDFSELFSVLLDADNFSHMANILPVRIHLRQVLEHITTQKVIEGLVLKDSRGNPLIFASNLLYSRVAGVEFEVTGLDKAFVLST
ncbi:hypothetical protein Tco_0874542 [Tanacetum coccineum]|uniref:Uncharacterized protein n=1 Tax=Tanacetum coccineum TaxID=301880 RepID=A0ABQ5BM98_9ASTR